MNRKTVEVVNVDQFTPRKPIYFCRRDKSARAFLLLLYHTIENINKLIYWRLSKIKQTNSNISVKLTLKWFQMLLLFKCSFLMLSKINKFVRLLKR